MAPAADISNGIILAKLYLPDAHAGYYQGVRFDWSGNFADLEYNGHKYIGQWFPEYNPRTHDAVMGPVEDFIPAGFKEANPGESFLKIGVGMLVKPDNKVYTIRRLYEFSNPGKWTVNKSKDKLNFIHELKDPGYSYQYEKTVLLSKDKPELILSHILKNTGNRIISTSAYDHNFFIIDKQPVGQVEIIFPYLVSGDGWGFGKLAEFEGQKIRFLRDLEKNEVVYCSNITGFGPDVKDYDIRIENRVTRAGIRITCDQPIIRLPFWSCSTTACPEPYIAIIAGPGEEMNWNIRYEFYTF